MFLEQYWGGPRTYSDRRGHPRLRMRHAGFRIGERERDAWLHHMRVAVDELDLPQPGTPVVGLPGQRGVQHGQHLRREEPARAGPHDRREPAPLVAATRSSTRSTSAASPTRNGDGIGDIAGIRSPAAVPARPRRRRRLDHARSTRHRWRTAGTTSPTTATSSRCSARWPTPTRSSPRRTRSASGCIIDIVPNHTSDQHPWFQAALAAGRGSPERARYIFRDGRGAAAASAAERLAVGLRRAGLDPASTGRRSGTSTCSPPSSPTSTGATRRCTRSSRTILRFWLDRGVDGFRIDVAHGLAKDPALPDLGEPTTLLRSRAGLTTRTGTATSVHDDLPRLARGSPTRTTGDADVRRRGVGASPDRLARVRAPGRAAHRLQLRLPQGALGRRRAAHGHRRHRSRPAPSAHRPPGCCPTTTSTATSPGTAAGHAVAATTSSTGRSAGRPRARAPARPRRRPADAGPARAARTSTRARSSACRRSWTCRTTCWQDPIWERSGRHRPRAATAAGCRIPWTGDGPSFGFGDERGRGCRSRPTGRKLCVEAQDGVDGSTLELYRPALRLRHELLHGEDLEWVDVPGQALLLPQGGRRQRGRVHGQRRLRAGAAAGVRQGPGRQRAARRRRAPGRDGRVAPPVLTATGPFGPVCTYSVRVVP